MRTIAIIAGTAMILAVGAVAYEAQAAPCGNSTPAIKGKFSSYSVGNNTLGTIKAVCVNGVGIMEGAISGETIERPGPYAVVMKHIMAVPRHGLVFTGPDVLTITGADPNNPNILFAEEKIAFIGGTGEFKDCTGTGTARGTINSQTGQNDFRFEANLVCQ